MLEALPGTSAVKPVRPTVIFLYVVLFMLATRWIYSLDADVGMVAFYILLIPFFYMLEWPNHPVVLYLGLSIMFVGKFVYAVTTDPLFGPDAKHYYKQVNYYTHLGDFMSYAVKHIETNFLDASAYPIFGLLYMPYYKFLDNNAPLTIITLNSVLFIFCCYLTYRLNKTFFRYEIPDNRTYYAVLLFGMFTSPSFMYLSSVFAKDVACALLGLYSAYLLLKRKYILFLLVIIYSTMLRDYAIVYSLCFYVLFDKRIKSAVAMMIGAIGIVIAKVGILGIFNALLLMLFLFISPNPVKPDNWSSDMVLRTVEALYMLITLLLATVVFIRNKETRSFYGLCLILLYTYSCVLVLVGYTTVTGRDMEYAVGTVGDNMVRKKLPVLPILYMMNAYTVAWLVKTAYHNKRVGRRLP